MKALLKGQMHRTQEDESESEILPHMEAMTHHQTAGKKSESNPYL